ncbi:MAG: hypothetical protein IAC69_02485 [Proteobacteria bacterium]|uniref:Uncharacterized protein n=1 Tax=Candidatus Enterousia avistercoris TaxID=2840788 RepID=A0A9D9DDT8_9PROT|nr:hypothetical protein [Candidatus Enterousia avistercoris]
MRQTIFAVIYFFIPCIAICAPIDALPPSPYTSMYKQVSGLEAVIMYTRADELYNEYVAAVAREHSTANKLLGGLAIGAGGVGGMMLASGLAEQRADENAMRDMTAYIATFRCDYGAGRNIQGGETEIILPAANLIELKNEFITLASDVKSRKAALNLPDGIESTVIIDSATTGLYDNAATGITSGGYASVYRAITDSDSTDAAAIAEQTVSAEQKTKTGAIVGGVGVVGGAVGDLIINRDNN